MTPQLKLSSDAIEAISLIEENVLLFSAKGSEFFITGELLIDNDWNEYLLELEKMGYKTIEEIWNSAWIKQNE